MTITLKCRVFCEGAISAYFVFFKEYTLIWKVKITRSRAGLEPLIFLLRSERSTNELRQPVWINYIFGRTGKMIPVWPPIPLFAGFHKIRICYIFIILGTLVSIYRVYWNFNRIMSNHSCWYKWLNPVTNTLFLSGDRKRHCACVRIDCRI